MSPHGLLELNHAVPGLLQISSSKIWLGPYEMPSVGQKAMGGSLSVSS